MSRFACALLLALLAARSAAAVPSPERLVQTASLLPYVLAGIATVLAAALLLVRRVALARRDPVRFLASIVVAQVLLLGAGAVLLAWSWQRDAAGRDAAALAMEFRCDLDYHAQRTQTFPVLRALWSDGAVVLRPWSAMRAQVLAEPRALVLDVRLPLWFDSGHLGAPGLAVEQVYPSELAARLERALAESPVPALVLVTAHFNPLGLLRDDEVESVAAALRRFPRVYQLVLRNTEPELPELVVAGGARANLASAPLPWPVARDYFLLDEQAVAFPRATEVLDAESLAELLADDDVMLVVPFASAYRDAVVYVDELLYGDEGYLKKVPPPRVVVLDYSRPDLRAALAAAAARVRGHRFVCAGYSKFDCVHFGMDFAYYMHTWDPGSSYLGGSAELPAAAGLVAQARSRPSLARDLEAVVTAGIRALARASGSPAVALVLAGALLRLLATPLTLGEALSRRRRRALRAAAVGLPALAPRLQRRLEGLAGCSAALELLGAATSLLLLAAGAVAARALGPLAWGGDGVLTAAVAAVAALQVALAYGVAWALPAFVAFAAALLSMPAGLALYALGVLAAGAALEAVAGAGAAALAERVLRAAPRARRGRGSARLHALDLDAAAWPKAARLAELARASTPLFDVPEGVVVPPGAGVAELPAAGPGGYAVRSAARLEDGPARSLAGAFASELRVAPADVAAALARVRASVGADGAVIVQAMAPADLAGVLFTRAPDNHGVALVELGDGTAEQLVAGRRAPRAYQVGLRSGEVAPAAGDLAPLLERLVLAGLALERRRGRAQDIEWTYSRSSRRLCFVQARDVTSAPSAPEVAAEQERLLARAFAGDRAKRGAHTWSALAESVRAPSPLSAEVLCALYDAGFAGALRLLGIGARPHACAELVFGELYANLDALDAALGPLTRLRLAAAHGGLERLRAGFAAALAAAPPLARAGSPAALAAGVVRRLEWFIHELYPHAMAAGLLGDGAAGAVATRGGALVSALGQAGRSADPAELIARFGHRAAADWELATPSFAEDPAAALAWARRFVAVPELRAQAPGAPLAAALEDMKDASVRALREVRAPLLELGRVLGLDAFALTTHELRDLAAAEGLGARVAERKRTLATLRTQRFGAEVRARDLELLAGSAGAGVTGERGRFVSAARAFAGPARHVAAGRGCQPGDVIVTPWLEPELVALFGTAAACITETGGQLSHAAIVARELGFPVLLLPGATAMLADGAHVAVDSGGRLVSDPGT